jgi:tRNA/rRNA methyltransferase
MRERWSRPGRGEVMNLHVVLVRTEYSSNIGATARAMANMGADRLILIDPKCPLDDRAKEMAAGAQDQLTRAQTYSSWNDFFASEGEGLRLGLTRRGGHQRKVFPLKAKLAELQTASRIAENVYLFFGPEADGLNSEDLAYMNFTVHLPIYGEFGSLNLAQAALLTLFIVRESLPNSDRPTQVKGTTPESVQPLYFPDRLIKEWLTAMGFNVQARRASAYLTLRKLFLQNLPTRHEIQVLEAVLQQNIRKLKSIRLTAKDLADDLGDVAGKDVF